MRYQLESGIPVLVTKITVDGRVTTNPTDAMIDEAGLGYPLLDAEAPDYDPDEEAVSFQWVLEDNRIEKVWTVVALTEEEKNAKHNQAIDAQIDEVNAGFEVFKTTPVDYEFKGAIMKLKPIWTTEYYGTLQQVGMIVGESMFPTVITDAAGVSYTMTQEEFTAMYLWLVQVSYTEIATVNARLAELEGEKR